jgi:CMP-N-acetylneuraminic acid synthetase
MITAFLPCRSGSERVKNKNTREFCLKTGKSLFEIKMDQLLAVRYFDKIIVSTNDPLIKEATKPLLYDKRVVVDDRPEIFSNSQTKTDDLIKYVSSIINDGEILWTHVTSPFADKKIYELSIEKYLESLKNGCDSLMSVEEVRGFLWNDEGPVNYEYSHEKWPKTQEIKPIFEVNNAVFIANAEIYKNFSNRIGNKPFLLKMEKVSSLDIDWEEDFFFCQKLYDYKQI